MSYSYKSINLNQIYVNDGSNETAFSYSGLPSNKGSLSNYTGMQPLSFGFNYQGTPINTSYTANSDTFYSSQTVSIPSGCKSFRYFSIAGGGGGGGNGGDAKATNNDDTNIKITGNGGAGGEGGYAVYVGGLINSSIIGNYTQFSVEVGNGGTAGTDGASKSTSGYTSGPSNTTTGDDGNDGLAGNASYIYFEPNASFGFSPAGNGGNGGTGAKADFDGPNGKVSSYDGTDGNIGTLTSSTYSYYQNIYPNLGNQGNPGAAGAAGMGGAIQIIWLFD